MAAKASKQAPTFSAFISHAKADAKKASAIAAGLEARGIKCWIAPRDVKAGRSYGDEIIRGIESAKSFVLVLSKASNDSAFVAREVERAVSKKKPIFVVRTAAIEPAPSLELFIAGTQWIDAFPGRLAAHVDHLAKLLAEDEEVVPPAHDVDDPNVKPRPTPRWIWPLGAAASVLIAIGAGFALWSGQQVVQSPDTAEPVVIKGPWVPKDKAEPQQQTAEVEQTGGEDEMIVGGRPKGRAGSFAPTGPSDLSASDPDFRACEKSSGEAAIAACDRAIASGKFKSRTLSYLYSDRGFMLMQKGEIEAAVVDLNKAIEIDSTNFYAFWNRGAIYAAKQDFEGARADFTTALGLNPDETSKAKIEEALNGVVDIAKAANTPPSDDSVITTPTWGNPEQNAAAAAPSYPADAMPASPAAEPTPMPVGPPPTAPASIP